MPPKIESKVEPDSITVDFLREWVAYKYIYSPGNYPLAVDILSLSRQKVVITSIEVLARITR